MRILTVALVLCLSAVTGAAAQNSEANPIVYIKSGRDALVATLVPDRLPGLVPADPVLVETRTDDQPAAFQLAAGEEGCLHLSGQLPGLEDGRHTAAVETFTPHGDRKDRKQLLFIVDSKAPVIERVAPMGDFFTRTAGAIQFKIVDPDNGSGVSIDPAECQLSVAIDGARLQESKLAFEANELHLTVWVAFPGGAAAHDARFSVSVTLQDRAGNIGRAVETFHTRGPVPPVFQIYRCNATDNFIETAGEFLVEPVYSGLSMTVGRERQLDLLTRGYFGKGFRYADKIRDILRRGQGIDKQTEPEIVTMNPFFQEVVGDLIEIQSTSANLAVRKTVDKDFKDGRISFHLTQTKPVAMGEQTAALLVTMPTAFRIDPSRVNYCAAKNQIHPHDENDTIYHHLPPEALSYTFETITIPVFMAVADEQFTMRVDQEDDQLAARLTATTMELVEAAASFFEFDGERYWFERQEDSLVAKGPVHEGRIRYTIAAAHKVAAFSTPGGGGKTGGRTLFQEGQINVCRAPPDIQNFRYDRDQNILQAEIDDEGTPLESLTIRLTLSGHPLAMDFNPETGKLTAELPYRPLAVLTASLWVTDLAKQTAQDTCQVFGDAETEAGTNDDSDAPTRGPYTVTPETQDIDRVLGTNGNGQTIVEICDAVMKWGYHENGRFVSIDSPPGALQLVQLRSRDPGNRDDSRMAITRNLPLQLKLFGHRYDENRYEPIPSRGGGVSVLTIKGGGASNASGRPFYYAALARDGHRTFPIQNRTIPAMGFQLKQFKQCRVVARDILAPVIRPRFDNATRLLQAAIHDHGMPLADLRIELTARSHRHRNIIDWGYHLHSAGGRPSFSFQNGILTSRIDLPPRGESFTLRIEAEDKAGNSSHVFLDLDIPRDPPTVSLTAETQRTDRVLRRRGEEATVFMTAEARDDSPIIPEKTTLWLDGQVLHPFTLYSQTQAAGWRSRFNFKAGYAAGVEEGRHLARFRATDALGLWAETTAAFDFKLAPRIHDFKVMPDAVRHIGGPAMTATIIDQGGDLDIDGLTLTIDRRPVDVSRLYYDPASGYFAVDGPLELAGGGHTAEITATDDHGNQARDRLRFRRSTTMKPPDQAGDHDLAIDELSLMELENHNGDGHANPGERVRLFVTLRNDSDQVLACTGRLSSEDLDIAVETESVPYGPIGPGSTLAPLKGFDLRIDPDILEKTISDPYEAYLALTLGCGPAEERVLSLSVPIQRPTIPIDTGLVLTLDRLPPTTTAAAYRVRGSVTSRAQLIDGMAIRVNGSLQGPVSFNREGGRFEALVVLADGANTIAVTGTDSNGARGSASGFIFRTTAFRPPSITITSPSDGDYYQCGSLAVTGTYNTGSGILDSITVDAPWETGGCPVTIIDATHFSVDCGAVVSGPAGIYDIEAVIETMDGIQSLDAVTVTVGDCS